MAAVQQIVRKVEAEYGKSNRIWVMTGWGHMWYGFGQSDITIPVHAKLFEFDAAGEETRFDLPRCMQIVKDAKWTGPLSIEFEGPVGEPGKPKDEVEGIAMCKKVLAKYGW